MHDSPDHAAAVDSATSIDHATPIDHATSIDDPSIDEVRIAEGPALTARELHDLLKLRVDVFVVEQACAYPELDGLDLLATTEHLWLADADGPQVALRILADPEGRRIGRVVTRPDRRGTGLAGRLMEWAHEHVGSLTTVLDGQSHLRAFYERLGYSVIGPEFVEDGIPHLPMRRTINTEDTPT